MRTVSLTSPLKFPARRVSLETSQIGSRAVPGRSIKIIRNGMVSGVRDGMVSGVKDDMFSGVMAIHSICYFFNEADMYSTGEMSVLQY